MFLDDLRAQLTEAGDNERKRHQDDSRPVQSQAHGQKREATVIDDKPASLTPPPEGYADWLADLKGRIHSAQQRATLAVNRELVLLYWHIGRDILARQALQGWGAKVIDRLAHDLRIAFPDMKGFSPRNLKYMRAFADAWPDAEFVQAVLAQLPWYHQLALLDKLPGPETRRWYAAKAIQHNWSRNVLVMQIETRLLERSGAAVTNFDARLPSPQSDLARESLKDPYRFDFLGLTDDAQEREIENALVKHVTEPDQPHQRLHRAGKWPMWPTWASSTAHPTMKPMAACGWPTPMAPKATCSSALCRARSTRMTPAAA